MTSSRMLMIVLIAAVVCVTVVGMGGAVPVEGWNKTFGGSNLDRGYSVQQTADGGYILAGETRSYGDINGDAWLIKTDGDGKEQWNKTFGRIYNDCANSVQQTSDGGYIIAGSSTSSDFYNDALLINTDANGNEKWNKTFSRGYQYDDGALSVQQTSDGGYVFAGRTRYYVEYPNDLIRDVWLVKTDANGKEQWNKTFEGSTGNYVQQTTDGGYIIAGGTDRYNAQLIKTDSNGQKQWNMTVEGSTAYSGQQTTDGGYIIAGGGYEGTWLIKTDSNGQKQWNITFERRTNYEEVALSVCETTDGGYVLVGYLYDGTSLLNDGWIIKADINGNEQWNKTFVNTEYINSVQQTKDGNYILAGSGVGIGVDAWLIKVSSDAETTTPVYNINMGTNYTTIQAAIDDASPGDEIHVDSGTYYENVEVNKQLILRGIDTGAGIPVVDVRLIGSAITLDADGITLGGFTATNAGNYPNAGIKVISSNNTLSGNIASNNSHNGILLEYSSNNTLIGNTVSNQYYGIYLYSSSNNMLTNNNCSNNKYGIELDYSNNNALTDNTFINDGLSVCGSFHNIVENNTVNGKPLVYLEDIADYTITNAGQVILVNCNNITAESLNLSDTTVGIGLWGTNDSTVADNNCSNNVCGIHLYSSSNNTLIENNCSNNIFGIFLSHYTNYNTLYHNNLINNTYHNAYSNPGTNQWDSGSEGNYYSDYTGTDNNTDGIGDTHHPIPGGTSIDRFPLMHPWTAAPRSGKIAFASFRDGNQEIYVMNADGSGDPINLTNCPGADDGDPTWSPDGTQIAFSSNRSGKWKTYVMNADDGSNQVCLLEDVHNAGGPAWSPDGMKIAVAVKMNLSDDFEIYTLDIQSRALNQVTDNNDTDSHPAWSLDSRKIVFTSTRDGNQEIYVADLPAGTQTRLTNNSSNDDYPEWSPDGSMIVFVSGREGNPDIYSMDIASKAITRLTYNGSIDKHAHWSPDGQTIVFISDRGGDMDIYVMNVDGTGVTCLVDWEGEETHPTWSPDQTPHDEVTLTLVGITEDTLPNHAMDVCVSGNYAYVADYTNGLVIVDISDPTNPVTVGNHPSRVYDRTAAAVGVAVSGTYAYVANWYDDLYVLDVTDPTNPTLAATYDTGDGADKVTISGDYVYISSQWDGVDIIDISDPTNPGFVGNYDTDDLAEDVAISGNHAYIADRSDGVITINISDPANPSFVGSCDTPDDANSIVVAGNHAYVADAGGFVVIDVSNPVAPAIVGQYDTSSWDVWGVALSGDYVYVGDGPNGVVVLNVSDPTNLVFAGGYDTPGYAGRLVSVGDMLYVADDRLVILRIDKADASQKGDLNGDNQITPADAAIALRLAASGAHDDAADVSGDGCVTSLDALMILQAAAGGIAL